MIVKSSFEALLCMYVLQRGTDQVDSKADHAVDDVDVEERHDHHDADCAGQDDVHHAQDQEGDHQAPHLQTSCSHLVFSF